MSVLLVFAGLFSVSAQAGVISTESAVTQQAVQYDRAQLLQAINEQGVRDQLSSLGVDPGQVEQRIQTLTGDELAQLNAQIQDMPAGQSALGVLATIFIVFIITDMLCATDIFNFVNCINR